MYSFAKPTRSYKRPKLNLAATSITRLGVRHAGRSKGHPC
jgi:hypothetical protein